MEFDFLIIGAGLLGLRAAAFLSDRSESFLIIEKNSRIGGVWTNFANFATAIQSEAATYSFHFNSNNSKKSIEPLQFDQYYPSRSQVIFDAESFAVKEKFDDKIRLNVEVLQVLNSSNIKFPYELRCFDSSSSIHFSLFTRVIWSFPGNLHLPRQLTLPKENNFKGKIFYGHSSAIEPKEFLGERVIIFGHGAFAIENARTALTFGSSSVTILCRKRHLIMPRLGSYITNTSKFPLSVDTLINYSQLMYSAIAEPSIEFDDFSSSGDWPISDFYFLAILSGKLKVLQYESVQFEPNGIVCCNAETKENLSIKASIVVKCFGFTFDSKVLSIFNSQTLAGYWINRDPNLFIFPPPDRNDRSSTSATSFFPIVDMILPFAFHFATNRESFNRILPSMPNFDSTRPPHFTTDHFLKFIESCSREPILLSHVSKILDHKVKHTLELMPFKQFYKYCVEDWKKNWGILSGDANQPMPEYPISLKYLRSQLIQFQSDASVIRSLKSADNSEFDDLVDSIYDFGHSISIPKMFSVQANIKADLIACRLEGKVWTFSELKRQVESLTLVLIRDYQIKPGMRVGQCVDRSLEMLVAILAIMSAGAVYVPLNPSDPIDRLSWLIADIECNCIIVTHCTSSLIDSTLNNFPYLRSVSVLNIDEKLVRGEINQTLDTPFHTAILIDPSAPCYVIYTSGSTGVPKGAQLNSACFSNFVSSFRSQFLLNDFNGERMRMLQLTSCSFDVHMADSLSPLLLGGESHMSRQGKEKDLEYIVKLIKLYEINSLFTVPSFLEILANHCKATTSASWLELSSLRFISSGGEPLRSSLANDFNSNLPNLLLCNLYGPA